LLISRALVLRYCVSTTECNRLHKKMEKQMDWPAFKTRVPGKWVLAGEHSVLRGATAVALPHPELGLTLSFEPQLSGLVIQPSDADLVIRELLQSVADAWAENSRVFQWPNGTLKIESDIPIGAELGSSAALCVGLTQWMAGPLALTAAEWIEFATSLEHRFHGRSSGMDVAVISVAEPISFVMGADTKTLGVKRLPKFTFHDTGLRSRTSECVLRVEKFRENVPTVAVKVDESMSTASRMAMEGLVRFDVADEPAQRTAALKLIQQSMQIARECFYCWELVPGQVKRLEEKLIKDGALAVKLTGAGGGGVLVALWDDDNSGFSSPKTV
jgi:mevalonate kinase